MSIHKFKYLVDEIWKSIEGKCNYLMLIDHRDEIRELLLINELFVICPHCDKASYKETFDDLNRTIKGKVEGKRCWCCVPLELK